MFDALGDFGLEHKVQKRTWRDKFKMIQLVLEGQSIRSVALANGMQGILLSKWCKFLMFLAAVNTIINCYETHLMLREIVFKIITCL